MWIILGTGITFVLTLVFSFAKASSRAEEITVNHREELLARENDGGKGFAEGTIPEKNSGEQQVNNEKES